MHESTEYLGVRFDQWTMNDLVEEILSWDGGFRYVVTPNVVHMVGICERRDELAPIYDAAHISLCDSRVLAHLARLSGIRLQALPGSDLTEALLKRADERKDLIKIIGSTPEEIRNLERRLPNVRIACHSPPFGFMQSEEEVDKCLSFVAEHPGHVTLIAVGSPNQERLAQLIKERGNACGTGLCIGAAVDFLTGRQRRAPLWMQRLSLEWLYRLCSDPRRLASRYLIQCPKIFFYAARR